MTKNEEKVLDCVRRLDDGAGLTAEGYYNLYGSWNTPAFPSDMNDFDVNAFLKSFEEDYTELNMSSEQFARILDSLSEQGYLRKIERTGGGYLYSANL